MIAALIVYGAAMTLAALHCAWLAKAAKRIAAEHERDAQMWQRLWHRSVMGESPMADLCRLSDEQVDRIYRDIFAPCRPSRAWPSTIDELMPRIVEGE